MARHGDSRAPEKAAAADCTWSLARAVQDAGGALQEDTLDMTLREFIASVAGQNNIRFVYVGPKKEHV